MLQNCLLFDILVVELKESLCLDTIIDAQSVLRCVAAVQNTGLEMKKTPKGQVLLLELETVGSPCRQVRHLQLQNHS